MKTKLYMLGLLAFAPTFALAQDAATPNLAQYQAAGRALMAKVHDEIRTKDWPSAAIDCRQAMAYKNVLSPDERIQLGRDETIILLQELNGDGGLGHRHLPPPAAAVPADSTTPETTVVPTAQDAVDRALAWLASNQKPDGTFPQDSSAGTTAVPSLAVMAFLARGHMPGQGEYGDLLNRSIDYVLDSQQQQNPAVLGLFSRTASGNQVMYEHGISTVMLSEAYRKVDAGRQARIQQAIALSVQKILAAQNVKKDANYDGGWRYLLISPDSDISVTGWQMLALRGASLCGVPIPQDALVRAREYVRRSSVPTGGFGYQPGQPANPARTGTGILMLELSRDLDPTLAPGEHPKEALAAGDWLMKNTPDNKNMDFYYYAIYYCSQALGQLGGNYWDTLYPGLRDTLLTLQQPDGSFGGSSGPDQQAGPAYRTSMACLALCVPYRSLPVYQRGIKAPVVVTAAAHLAGDDTSLSAAQSQAGRDIMARIHREIRAKDWPSAAVDCQQAMAYKNVLTPDERIQLGRDETIILFRTTNGDGGGQVYVPPGK